MVCGWYFVASRSPKFQVNACQADKVVFPFIFQIEPEFLNATNLLLGIGVPRVWSFSKDHLLCFFPPNWKWANSF